MQKRFKNNLFRNNKQLKDINYIAELEEKNKDQHRCSRSSKR